jgi:hypothetical protein
MATPPITAMVLQWGDETTVVLDWTAEPAPTANEGELDFSNPDNSEYLPLV